MAISGGWVEKTGDGSREGVFPNEPGSCPQDVGRGSGLVLGGGGGWAGIPLSASSQPRSGTRPGKGG
jgi:hypothetical protein